MNYINFLKEKITFCDVVNELDLIWDNNSDVAIVKSLQGIQFEDSKNLPLQILFKTQNIDGMLALIYEFINNNNLTYTLFEGNSVYQQYFTPYVVSAGNEIDNNYYSTIILTGTLITTLNSNDISRIIIDNQPIKTTQRKINYSTATHNYKITNKNLNVSNISKASLNFSFDTILKNNQFFSKINQILSDKIAIDTIFNVKIYYLNDTVINYNMKLYNYSETSSNGALPVASVVLGV